MLEVAQLTGLGPSKEDVVEELCRMPVTFNQRGDIGMYQLAHEIGYPAMRSWIQVSDIEKCLRDHPWLVKPWVIESEDYRGRHQWALVDPRYSSSKSTKWSVTLRTEGQIEEHTFEDRFAATAFFIKHYVDLMLSR